MGVGVFVLDSISERHPHISKQDVLAAFRARMVSVRRQDGSYIAVGLDMKGRNIEMVYVRKNDDVLVFHAFTPPTKKFLREIEGYK